MSTWRMRFACGWFASSWDRSDFEELVVGNETDWATSYSLHLYHSQTGYRTIDPIQLCRSGGESSVGSLCAGLWQAVNLSDVFAMVDRGFPLEIGDFAKQFAARRAAQEGLSWSTDVVREASKTSEL